MKVIKPKQAALAQAEGELKVAQDELRTKQQALQKVRDHIHQLQSNYQASQRKLEDLTKQKETIEIQLDRAAKLQKRKKEEINEFQKDIEARMGNIISVEKGEADASKTDALTTNVGMKVMSQEAREAL